MTSSHINTFSQPSISESDTLMVALFLAAVFHAFLLLGINFSFETNPHINRQIEITLTSAPTKKPPKNAKFLAQNNQIGAGKNHKPPKPPRQQLPSQGKNLKKNRPALQNKPRQSHVSKAQKLLTRKKATHTIKSLKQKQKQSKTAQKRPTLSADLLRKQISQLGENIRHGQKSEEQTRIKFVNSVSAHRYVAAQYMKDWEDKVERTGNLNYPDVARHKGFSGSLTMDVGINADGSIYSIRISRSSGNPALDAAAKRIVRLSAPFAALPEEILEELDVLVIPRVWKFSDESGITTR